jgi:hypothetical protein
MDYAHIEAGIVDRIIIADETFIAGLPDAGEWVPSPYGVAVGWAYSAGVFTGPQGQPPPPPPGELPVYLMDGAAWVMRFTDAEWDWLAAQRKLTTAAGKQLNKMMDAIRWLNAVDVSSPNMDAFYNWMLAQGIPGGQTRIDELREPV